MTLKRLNVCACLVVYVILFFRKTSLIAGSRRQESPSKRYFGVEEQAHHRSLFLHHSLENPEASFHEKFLLFFFVELLSDISSLHFFCSNMHGHVLREQDVLHRIAELSWYKRDE